MVLVYAAESDLKTITRDRHPSIRSGQFPLLKIKRSLIMYNFASLLLQCSPISESCSEDAKNVCGDVHKIFNALGQK